MKIAPPAEILNIILISDYPETISALIKSIITISGPESVLSNNVNVYKILDIII